MFKKKEKSEVKDVYWWLGPVGVIAVVLLMIFAMMRSATPLRLDDLADRTKNRARRALAGKHRAIWLGMEVTPVTRSAITQFGIKPGLRGVVVTDLDQGPGGAAGMNVGDVIVAINGAKITDFESFLWLGRQSKFSDGILLDVITNGKRRYVSLPFLFQGGPLMGPNTQHWQLGGPLSTPRLGFGKLVGFANSPNQSFLICPLCGHTTPATPGSSIICPNCGVQMVANQ